MIKKIFLALLIVLIVIQFIHPEKNISTGAQANYIGNVYAVPGDVKAILTKACNDCHTNNTKYPWYTYIQPFDWWMNDHVKDGKKELNFDEYANKNPRYQYHKMEEITEMVKEGEMPLDSYTWMHKDAKLTEAEKNMLTGWADAIRDSMKLKYPIDSLVRKKLP
ncbi:MAG: heme-binding domain-containing protein [Chitinophagaceae bacterium]